MKLIEFLKNRIHKNKTLFNLKIDLETGEKFEFQNVIVSIKEFKKPMFYIMKNSVFSLNAAIVYIIDNENRIMNAFFFSNNLIIVKNDKIEVKGNDKIFLLKKGKNEFLKNKLKKSKKLLEKLNNKISLGLTGEEIILLSNSKREYEMNFLLYKNGWIINKKENYEK
ncbi:hypothetical protein [[Mycoplasma] mobile]|nr:hypothetical protein [[Mycoplasma] mobile]